MPPGTSSCSDSNLVPASPAEWTDRSVAAPGRAEDDDKIMHVEDAKVCRYRQDLKKENKVQWSGSAGWGVVSLWNRWTTNQETTMFLWGMFSTSYMTCSKNMLVGLDLFFTGSCKFLHLLWDCAFRSSQPGSWTPNITKHVPVCFGFVLLPVTVTVNNYHLNKACHLAIIIH